MYPNLAIILLLWCGISPAYECYYQINSYNPKYKETKFWFHKINCQHCPCPYYQSNVDSNAVSFPFDPRNEKRQIIEKHKCVPFCCKSKTRVDIEINKNQCGTKPPNKSNRIVNSEQHHQAQFSDWPWHTAILMVNQNKNYFVCSGVLIDSKHVLTVAHAIESVKNRVLFARLGEWNTQDIDESLPHGDYLIRKITVHPRFNPKLLWNDIAILELATKVKYRQNIRNICVPDRTTIDSTKCVVTGWGKDAYVGGKYSALLKEASVRLVEFNQCQFQLRKTRLGNSFKLHDSFICAGADNKSDSCKGDGGGPLACSASANGPFYLKGLVSWGVGCGKKGVAGVYVDVEKFMPWIISNL